MNFYAKKILFFYSFFFFNFYAVQDSKKINELFCVLADEAPEGTVDFLAILDSAIFTLLNEDQYGWNYKNSGLTREDLKAITMDYFEFHDEEITKNINSSFNQETKDIIKRKFLGLEKIASTYQGKVTIEFLTFLDKAHVTIMTRLESNEINKNRKKNLNQGLFSNTKTIFSSFNAWEEQNNHRNPDFKFFIKNGKDRVSHPPAGLVVNIREELIKYKNFSKFFDVMKEKTALGDVILQFDHLEDYDYEQLKNLQRILEDMKVLINNNVTILCRTNFSDIAALYKKVFLEKPSNEVISYEADSFVSADSFFSHSGNVYLYPQDKASFALSSLENSNQSHKIYLFIDSHFDFDKNQYEVFVEEMKKKNRSFSLEFIPVFQNNIKEKKEFKTKKIPSFFEELTGKELQLWDSLKKEEQNEISLLVRRNKIGFREWKKLFGTAKDFNNLKHDFLQLFSKKYGSSCDFLHIVSEKKINKEQGKKSLFQDASLVYFQNTGMHIFPSEKVKNKVRSYLQEDSSAEDILMFDFLSNFKEIANLSAHSPDDIKIMLKNKAKENVEEVKSLPVFNAVKKYNFIDAYALKMFLKEKIGPELSSLYKSREHDSGEFESKIEQDLDDIYSSIIQEIVANKSSVPVLFVGPKKILQNEKNTFIVKDIFSSHEFLIKKLFSENNISEEFSLKILTQFPIPSYFSLEEKEKLIKFVSDKFNFYKMLHAEQSENLFFEDEAITDEVMTEIFRVIELLPTESMSVAIQDVIFQNQSLYSHLFFKPSQQKSAEELKQINIESENKQIFNFLFHKTKKRFSIEDVRKIRLTLKNLGMFGQDAVKILEIIFSDKKNHNLKERNSAEIASFVVSNLYYSFLDKINTDINYTMSVDLKSFFSIQPENYKYDSSFLHSELKSHINEQFNMFKKDRTKVLVFNIGGATGAGKTEGVNEVRKQLAEIVGEDPIVIKVGNTQTKYVGSDQKYLGHLHDLCRKFIKQGKYVILQFDEIDRLVGQSSNQSSVDGARDSKRSGEFKDKLEQMGKELGSHLVFYSTSNHRMILRGENQSDNKENQAVIVEDAILGRIGKQKWLPYVERNQYNLFSKKILAQKKQINAYSGHEERLDEVFKIVSNEGSFNEGTLQSCVNNVFFEPSDGKDTGLREVENRISLLLQQLEDSGNNYSVEDGIRKFVCEENKKKFKESMNSFWKGIKNSENFTQAQPKKTGETLGKIAGGILMFLGATDSLPQSINRFFGADSKKRESVLGVAAKLVEGAGSVYDNSKYSEEERQNLAIRSEKGFIKSLLVSNSGESLYEKVTHICGLYFIRLKLGNYNKSGELMISETETINDFIFKEVYGVPLKKKIVTNGVNLRTWITFEKIKNKLRNIDTILVSLDEEKKEYYLAKILDTISPHARVNKDFAKKRLSSIDNYFASETNKKEFKLLMEDDLQAKIDFNLDSSDHKKREKVNSAENELFNYLKILNANAVIRSVEEKIKNNEDSFKKFFTKRETDSFSKL
jgi:hypothetical protein